MLFYAMFFEHSINAVIRITCIRKKLSEKTKKEILRNININGKFSWLLELLGLPRFNHRHGMVVTRTCEERNAFAHYKYEGVLEAEEDKINAKIEKRLDGIEKTIAYMRRYEDKIVFSGKKKIIGRQIRRFS